MTTTLTTRRLGNTDMTITTVGFGAWAVGGGDWAFGWGPQEDDESIATIRHALARGINWIDTAAVYGLGHSEEVVRRALEGVPAGERPYIFTKCGMVWDERNRMASPGQDLRPGEDQYRYGEQKQDAQRNALGNQFQQWRSHR